MPWKIILIVVLVSVLGWVLAMVAFSLVGKPPDNLGVRDGRLTACPSSPNCVCSQDADAGHAVEPLRFRDDPNAAWRRLREVIGKQSRTHIVAESEGYLHAECTSRLFRFVDDLEFLLDRGGLIQVRSASRVGRSDLGVNRARVEAIRQAFDAGAP